MAAYDPFSWRGDIDEFPRGFGEFGLLLSENLAVKVREKLSERAVADLVRRINLSNAKKPDHQRVENPR